jgi:hypothetical protein
MFEGLKDQVRRWVGQPEAPVGDLAGPDWNEPLVLQRAVALRSPRRAGPPPIPADAARARPGRSEPEGDWEAVIARAKADAVAAAGQEDEGWTGLLRRAKVAAAEKR